MIIGENNSGKSTIFDGLRLWQLAFQKFLKDRTNNQQSSFYASQFYSFTIDDISFLRILDFKNLFNNNSKKEFEISLTISNGDSEVILPIIFLKTTKGQVLNFQLCKQPNHRPVASQKISDLFKIPLGSDFKELFLFTYINPIFLLYIFIRGNAPKEKTCKFHIGYMLILSSISVITRFFQLSLYFLNRNIIIIP